MWYGNNINCKIYFSVDCKWGEWKLGDCSATCGDGVRENHRFKEQEELYGGAPCKGDAKMAETCTARLCPGKRG